jgi:hypothetical protein
MSDVSVQTAAPVANTDPNAQVLVRFKWTCGRQGNVEGLFVTTRAELTAAYGKNVYFGEILGKHSEVYGTLDEGDITILTDDAEFVAKLVSITGSSVSGYNPFEYMRSDDE